LVNPAVGDCVPRDSQPVYRVMRPNVSFRGWPHETVNHEQGEYIVGAVHPRTAIIWTSSWSHWSAKRCRVPRARCSTQCCIADAGSRFLV